MKNKVIKHLKGDIKTFKKEEKEDRKLIKELKMKHKKPKKAIKALKKDIKRGKKEGKVGKVLHEFKEKKLHSGSKKGPIVKSKSQALAIGLSEARKAGESVSKKKKKR